jgi:hypothetical protein
MESVIITPTTKSGAKLLKDLASKLGYSFSVLTKEQHADIVVLQAMEKGRKTKPVSRERIFKALDRK